LAVDAAGNVYVPLTNSGLVAKFDSNGTPLLTWGAGGAPVNLFVPFWAAVDATGHVLVQVDFDGVEEFDSSGTFVRHILTDVFGTGVAVNGRGDLYVNDFNPADDPLGVGYDSGGLLLGTVAAQAELGVAVPPDGNPFFIESNVIQFDFRKPVPPAILWVDGSSLATLLAFGTYGSGNGQFTNPVGVATDTAGNVYVGDETAPPGRVEVFACPQAALCGNLKQPCCVGDVTAQLPLCNGTLVCDPTSNTCVGKLSKP
jgi:hypothetical protein